MNQNVIESERENIPKLASIMTDKKIMPVAPQPVKPTSSFPMRHKENVTQITTIIPKNTKIDGGKIKPNTAKLNIKIA